MTSWSVRVAKRQKVDFKAVGLEAGWIVLKGVLGTEHLHFGYWPDGLEVDIVNLPKAQQAYCDFVAGHIPDGARTILDVGCGTGVFARQLAAAGYAVDGVSPSGFLAARARELLGDGGRIFECAYEALETDARYDVVMFCESFQYTDPNVALDKTLKLLNAGGHLLICDFFKRHEKAPTDGDGKKRRRKKRKRSSALGGGMPLEQFRRTVAAHPFSLVEEIDITEQAAPNFAVMNHVLTEVGRPLWELSLSVAERKWPLLMRIAKWKFRKKLERIERRQFGGEKNAETFKRDKTYRLMLYKKADGAAAAAGT